MQYSLNFRDNAKADIIEGYLWYEEKQEGLGEDFLLAVHERIDNILDNPETYSKKGTAFREAKVSKKFPYTIVYRVRPRLKEVFINRVYHEKRDPRNKYLVG